MSWWVNNLQYIIVSEFAAVGSLRMPYCHDGLIHDALLRETYRIIFLEPNASS